MSTKDITPNFITTILKTFILGQGRKYHVWQPVSKVNEGNLRLSDDKLYVAAVSGVTGNTPPAHTTGKAQDGTVTWFYVGNHLAQYEMGANLHIGLGGPAGWLGNTPKDLKDTTDGEILDDLAVALRLNMDDMMLGCKRITWKAGVTYPMYPASDSYVNVGTNVYRCIDNKNDSVSTVEPTGTATHSFETADGYIWKFLGTVDAIIDEKYGTDEAFPVSTLAAHSTDTWSVQQAAKNGSISGFKVLHKAGTFQGLTPKITVVGDGKNATANVTLDPVTGNLERIYAVNIGQGYKHNNTFVVVQDSAQTGKDGQISVTVGVDGKLTGVAIDNIGSGYTDIHLFVVGDGAGAEVEADVVGGYLTNARVTNAGIGYTWAKVFVVAGNNYALGKAILAPHGGHGADMAKELPCNILLVQKKITALDTPYVKFDQNYSQITLLTGLGNFDRLTTDVSQTTLEKAQIGKARILYVSNINPIKLTHSDDSIIKIMLELR